MRKLLSYVIMVLLVVMSLSGCGNKTAQGEKDKNNNEEEKKINLTWMNHTGEDRSVQWEDEMVKKFTEENPNVTIDVQRLAFDNYVTSLQTKLASGDAPDIMNLEGDLLRTFAKNGYLTDLTNEPFIKNFNKKDLESLTYEGKIVAIANGFGSLCATYNKDVFEAAGIKEVPKTLDEFYQVCETLKAAGVAPMANGFKEAWCISGNLQADYITSVLAKDKNAILDVLSRKQKFVESDLWRDEFTRFTERFKYSNDDPFGTDWNGAGDMLATGKAGMIVNISGAVTHVKGKNPDVKLGIFPLPISNNPDETLLVVQSAVSGNSVYSESPNKEMALKFLDFLSTPEAATRASELTQGPSIVIGAVAPSDEPALADIFSYVENGMTFSQGSLDHNFPNEYRTAVENLVSKHLLTKDKNVDTLLKNLDTEFDRIAASQTK